MLAKRSFEIICGIIILIIFVSFVVYSFSILVKRGTSTYVVQAYFNEVGGLVEGNDVIIKGVKVGTVSSVLLSHNNTILVHLNINSDVKLPQDSVASVKDTDLFSGRKVQIVPGDSKKYLKNYDVIKNTKDYLYLEDKINRIIFTN